MNFCLFIAFLHVLYFINICIYWYICTLMNNSHCLKRARCAGGNFCTLGAFGSHFSGPKNEFVSSICDLWPTNWFNCYSCLTDFKLSSLYFSACSCWWFFTEFKLLSLYSSACSCWCFFYRIYITKFIFSSMFILIFFTCFE